MICMVVDLLVLTGFLWDLWMYGGTQTRTGIGGMEAYVPDLLELELLPEGNWYRVKYMGKENMKAFGKGDVKLASDSA